MEKILITGTDGFVGDYLKSHLEREGHSVYGTCYFKPPREHEYQVDIRNEGELEALPHMNFDVVIHTAGIVDQQAPKRLIFAVNYEGTRNVLKWSKRHSCQHFIQVSSSAVYGRRVMGENRRESKTKRIRGYLGIPYARSKAKAESLVEQSGLKYTILRLPGLIGGNDTCITPAVMAQLQKGKFVFCGRKDKLYSTLYIKNFAEIISKLLKVGPLNDVYNCTDYHITWQTFIQEYLDSLHLEVPLKTKSIFSLIPHYANKNYVLVLVFSRFGGHYPNEKLSQALAYEPKYPWQAGIKEATERWMAKRS